MGGRGRLTVGALTVEVDAEGLIRFLDTSDERELLAEDIDAVLRDGTEHARIHELAERLLDLAA